MVTGEKLWKMTKECKIWEDWQGTDIYLKQVESEMTSIVILIKRVKSVGNCSTLEIVLKLTIKFWLVATYATLVEYENFMTL